MEKKKIALATVAATAIALSSGQSALATQMAENVVTETIKVKTLANTNIFEVKDITKTGITVVYSEKVTTENVKKGTDIVVKLNETQYNLAEPAQINDDQKTVTYNFSTALPNMLYGTWVVDNVSKMIQAPSVYSGLKVLNIDKTGVTVKLPASAVAGEKANPIEVKKPDGMNVTLKEDALIATDKTVTYHFKEPLSAFVTGKWLIDQQEYIATYPKVANYEGLEVLSITTKGVVIQLPSTVSTGFAEAISIKNPSGVEMELGNLPQITTDKRVTYTFKTEPDKITTGKWTVNTDVTFTVLSEDANKAKVVAAQKKIKTARLTLTTNKNYIKNVLAAKAAVDALTYEQQLLFKKETENAQTHLDELLTSIQQEYTPIQKFETAVNALDTKATDFLVKFEAAEKQYTELTKTQLSYVDAKVKKQYTAYVNEAAVKKGLKTTDVKSLKATDINDFNKAYKKLTVAQKEPLLLDATSKKTIEALTDKTLQKNASAALAVQKKFNKLEVQKKNDKNKKLYYELNTDGTEKLVNGNKVETTTKTAKPVMVPSLSAVTKAQTALTALEKKNKAAYDLVDPELLTKAKNDLTIKSSIEKGKLFNDAVKAPSDITDFVSEFTKAKTAYIALTADEKKYAIDKNALKQYKAYLKIDKVAVMYAKMTAPEQTTKSMKLAHDTSDTVSSITNDVKFSKGKFTIPKGNYEFAFKDGDKAKVAYYKDGKWTVADTLPELTKTIATAQEIYAYAKAFNALKDADEAILTKGNNGAAYKQYVGKENDYKKAAAVEKKIVYAVKSKRKATIANAQKAYDALTAAQQPLVTNSGDLSALQK